MKNIFSIVLSIAVLAPAVVLADQDPILTTTLGYGDTLDLMFPNQVHPPPSVKVLQFTGTAESTGPAGIAAILGIHFDYTDATGNQVIVPLPNFYREAIQPNIGPVPIEAGPHTLPFCPEEVSIHFENLTEGTEITLSGIFDHTCVPVPEPSAAALAALGLLGIGFSSRRRA